MKRVIAALGLLILLVCVASLTANAALPTQGGANGQAATQKNLPDIHGGATVRNDVKHDVSPPLRDIPARLGQSSNTEHEQPLVPFAQKSLRNQHGPDTAVSRLLAPFAMPAPIQNFAGIYNYWGAVPPDTNGDVGPNHYVQFVNEGFQVFNKVGGASIYGPVDGNTPWRGFGGICEENNDGDPIVLYDPISDRWLLSQFAFNSQSGPTFQCFAISTSGDPTGSYYRYEFFLNQSYFDDYPKIGVWPDGYYMTTNEFGAAFRGGNFAFERPKMISGQTARMVYFNLPAVGGMLPTDLDGALPPAGTPNFFMALDDAETSLDMYKFHVDWTNPLSSTFTGPINIPVTPFNSTICNATRGQCIDEPGVAIKLESIADRLMHRMVYRNMGTYETLLVQHTVNALGATIPGIAGNRWYEIRDPNGARTVYQQGTNTAADNTHRWMGSIAMDRMGNIALGYSASSTTISPSIRYAGRLVTDPLGTMGQGEATLIQGQGVMNFPAAPRWGDYSAMAVDPRDDCTFWYTQEYYAYSGDRNWSTRIGSFKFPNCTGVIPTPTPCAINFTDVHPTDYFYAPVQYLFCRNVISGYGTEFRPYNNTSRGQLCKIVVLGMHLVIDTTGGPHFVDVPTTNVFYPYVETAFNLGIVSGYGTEFRPNDNVTRGQLSKIVVLAAGWDLKQTTTATFTDVPVGSTFFSYVETAYCHGIIAGYGTIFKPNDPATRGQISKIVYLAITNPPATCAVTCAGGTSTTVNGSIGLTNPTANGRLLRDFTPSTCAQPKIFPGISPSDVGQKLYASHTYTNTSSTAKCITVSVTSHCSGNGGNPLLSYAYSPSFDPTNLATNWIADAGTSAPTVSYSFNVPAGAAYVIVVQAQVANVPCEGYTLKVDTCAAQPTNTPTNTRTATNTFTPTKTNTAGPSPTRTITTTPTPASGCNYTFATSSATMIPGVNNNIGNACDDCVTLINLPFSVTVYGTPRTTANVGSNGLVNFNSIQQNIFNPNCIPVTTNPPPFASTVFAYYDDLMTVPTGTNTCPGCGIYTATVGTAPNRQFVIRWNTTYFNHDGENNFEVVLTEGSGAISVIYGTNPNNGIEAAAGMQFDVTRFTVYTCHTATLTNGSKVTYTPVGCLLDMRP